MVTNWLIVSSSGTRNFVLSNSGRSFSLLYLSTITCSTQYSAVCHHKHSAVRSTDTGIQFFADYHFKNWAGNQWLILDQQKQWANIWDFQSKKMCMPGRFDATQCMHTYMYMYNIHVQSMNYSEYGMPHHLLLCPSLPMWWWHQSCDDRKNSLHY